MNYLNVVCEFATIVRGQHPAWRGDRRENGSFYLRSFRRDFPNEAAALAENIEKNLVAYVAETGLPERTLYQAQRVLSGQWSGL